MRGTKGRYAHYANAGRCHHRPSRNTKLDPDSLLQADCLHDFEHTACMRGTVRVGRAAERRALALAMNFFEKTLRDWKVTLLPMAARKPGQLKVTSLVDASATPLNSTHQHSNARP